LSTSKLRIGNGFDIHRLVPDRPLLLGGLHIPFEFGLEGHSDGDALIHAVIDALLGAANLGDIGMFFPPGEARTKNMSSTLMIAKVLELLSKSSYQIVNIDTVVICESPKLSEHYQAIKQSLSALLKIDLERVSVKAKTAEKLGDIGAGKAIAVQAVVLLESLQ
jgi:2-C-methyl-D-erythritol 2,4-cyclodiphosphate synthase